MKNFFKYAFFILLIVLLISTLFNTNETRTSQSLDSNILIVESNNQIEISDSEPKEVNDGNFFAKIGAFFSNLIYQIFSFLFSIIQSIFVIYY